jgi:hypothetical protein
MDVSAPRIKRYALVPKADEDGIRRFQLARVASTAPGSTAERLERMEQIAELDRRENGSGARGAAER